MIGQFVRTNTETCRIAESKADLISLLSEGDGFRGIIVTIMHKFTGHESFAVPRTNVVALLPGPVCRRKLPLRRRRRALIPAA